MIRICIECGRRFKCNDSEYVACKNAKIDGCPCPECAYPTSIYEGSSELFIKKSACFKNIENPYCILRIIKTCKQCGNNFICNMALENCIKRPHNDCFCPTCCFPKEKYGSRTKEKIENSECWKNISNPYKLNSADKWRQII